MHNAPPEQRIRVWEKEKETQEWEHGGGGNEVKIQTIRIDCSGNKTTGSENWKVASVINKGTEKCRKHPAAMAK